MIFCGVTTVCLGVNLSFALYPKEFLSDESFSEFWNILHYIVFKYCFFFYYFLYFPLLEPLIQPNWIYFQFIFHDMCILSCVYVFMFLLVSDMFWGSSSVPSTSLLFLLLLYTHFIVDFMLSKDFSKYFPRFLICSFGVFYVSFLFLSVL